MAQKELPSVQKEQLPSARLDILERAKKKINMKNKWFLLPIFIGIILSVATIKILQIVLRSTEAVKIETIQAKKINDVIIADGSVGSESEAVLHFQTGGKLVYLPFKEGDSVQKWQTIASLDATILQKQLDQALASYRSTRAAFDQTQKNNSTGVLQGQQKYSLEVMTRAGISGQPEIDIINSMARTIVDQNQANLDASVLNTEIANQAAQLAVLNSPITGIITHEDVSVPGVNITPLTSFIVADPNALVFKANVAEADIAYVKEGEEAQIKLTGQEERQVAGTVVKIYPDKEKSVTGEVVYRVDIQSSDLQASGKLGQAGTAIIKNTVSGAAVLVPSWVVLDRKYVWILKNGKANLQPVAIHNAIGGNTEIVGGLRFGDAVIINPKSVIQEKYFSL